MASLNVNMPKDLREFVDQQTEKGGFETPTEYVRHLIRKNRDEEGDQENAVRDIIAALLHYCTTTPLTHSITGERWDPVEEARMGVWHWYSEHINPGGYAADDPEHTVEITIKHKHSELFEALSR